MTLTFAMLDMEMANQEFRLAEEPGHLLAAAPALVMVGHWGLAFNVTPRGGAVQRPRRRPRNRMSVHLRLLASLIALAAGAAAVVVVILLAQTVLG